MEISTHLDLLHILCRLRHTGLLAHTRHVLHHVVSGHNEATNPSHDSPQVCAVLVRQSALSR